MVWFSHRPILGLITIVLTRYTRFLNRWSQSFWKINFTTANADTRVASISKPRTRLTCPLGKFQFPPFSDRLSWLKRRGLRRFRAIDRKERNDFSIWHNLAPFWLIVFPFSYHVSGCAFLTYYSRDSAISAQNALHEKRTLPGVSVYAFRTQFTYFQASSTWNDSFYPRYITLSLSFPNPHSKRI